MRPILWAPDGSPLPPLSSKHGELSLDAFDKLTHRYQNPWQPNPSVLDQQGRYSRAFLAWHMGDYEDPHQRDSKRATLTRQSKSPPRKPQPPKLPRLPTENEVRVGRL
ncbi:hypothetical protein H920_06914 [Fukomys damarensis]|uniref:Uncharacterized protein n=1 Tax=Fukomys damarensis TaxID=885580 RepID=A0A091DNA0_FUKDA|nr:hypothetical protein H920_06914 [Fukomys damarensis]